jgi:hypothetical protein
MDNKTTHEPTGGQAMKTIAKSQKRNLTEQEINRLKHICSESAWGITAKPVDIALEAMGFVIIQEGEPHYDNNGYVIDHFDLCPQTVSLHPRLNRKAHA